jgi:hypothetical protein
VTLTNKIAFSEPSWLASNVNKTTGIDFQNINSGANLPNISSLRNSISQNKINLSSESESNLSPLETNIISLHQPQYSPKSPINKTQYSFGAILESQYENYSINYQNSSHKNSTGYSFALPPKEVESTGYYLTIPQEQLNKMKSYKPLSHLQRRLRNTSYSDQNLSKGSLVNLIF